MDTIFLSNNAHSLLEQIAASSPVSVEEIDKNPSYQEAVYQLLKYGFIENPITGYDTSGSYISTIAPEYKITEYGRGYLAKYQSEESFLTSVKSIASSAEQQANSAKSQADLARQQAEKAENISLLARLRANASIIISSLALIVSFLANADKIAANVEKILVHLGLR